MRHLLIKAIAGAGLLALGTTTASAQYQPRPDYRYRMDERGMRVFDRSRADLERVQANTLPFTGDRSRVTMALNELSECQRAVANDSFSRREFNEAIGAMQRVVELNRISDRSRDFLTNDMSDLRRLQERLEGY